MKKFYALPMVFYFTILIIMNHYIRDLTVFDIDYPFVVMIIKALVFILFGGILAFSFSVDLKKINDCSLGIFCVGFFLIAASQIMLFIIPISWIRFIFEPLTEFRILGQVGFGFVIWAVIVQKRKKGQREQEYSE